MWLFDVSSASEHPGYVSPQSESMSSDDSNGNVSYYKYARVAYDRMGPLRNMVIHPRSTTSW